VGQWFSKKRRKILIKIGASLTSLVIAFVISSIPKLPVGLIIAIGINILCTLVLVYICAVILSKVKTLKDYPLSSSFMQYTFVAISAIYLGESYGDALRGGGELNVPSLGAALLVGFFCLGSIAEAKIPAPKKDDLPPIGRRISKERTKDVLLGACINIIAPFIIGACFSTFF